MKPSIPSQPDPACELSDVEQPSTSMATKRDSSMPSKLPEGNRSNKALILVAVMGTLIIFGLLIGLGFALIDKGSTISYPDEPNPNPDPAPNPNPDPAPKPCVDSIAWVDKNNKGCGFYKTIGCSAASSFRNAAGVDASEACCLCGGGDKNFEDGDYSCSDMFGFVDSAGYDCGEYDSYGCSTANFWPNSKRVTAKMACCKCGGGRKNW